MSSDLLQAIDKESHQTLQEIKVVLQEIDDLEEKVATLGRELQDITAKLDDEVRNGINPKETSSVKQELEDALQRAATIEREAQDLSEQKVPKIGQEIQTELQSFQ